MSLRIFTRFGIVASLMLLCITFAAWGKSAKDDKRAKARYFYLKGAESSAREEYDEAYEFYKKAFLLDPSYVEAAYDYGAHRLVLLDDTFSTREEVARSLGFMRGLVDQYPKDIVAAESYAYYAMDADTLEEALRVYNIMVKEHPGLSRLYYPQSLLYMQLGQKDSALNAIRQYERLEGATSETVVRKLSYLLSDGDTVGAFKEVRDYAISNPGNPRVILDQAMIYNAMNYPDSAINTLENGLKEFPDNGDMQFDLGFLYLAEGDSTNFHTMIRQALTSDYFEYEDKLEGLRMYLSKLPVKGYAFKESDRLVNEINVRYPDEAALMDLTANYYYIKGDKQKAYETVKKAYALDPQDANMLGRFVTYSVIADKPREGMKAFDAYTNETDKSSFSLGVTYISAAEAVKDYDKAMERADKILKAAMPELSIDTKTDEIRQDTLLELSSVGDLNVASATFEIIGDLFSRMNKPEDAVRSYENALAIPVDNPSVMNNYAYFIVETLKAKPGSPEFDKAKKMSYESIEKTAETPQATFFDTYAWILFKEQDYENALQFLEISLELEGDDPPSEILSHYGDALFMSGKPAEALEQWKRALKSEPDNALLKKKVEHKTFFYE